MTRLYRQIDLPVVYGDYLAGWRQFPTTPRVVVALCPPPPVW